VREPANARGAVGIARIGSLSASNACSMAPIPTEKGVKQRPLSGATPRGRTALRSAMAHGGVCSSPSGAAAPHPIAWSYRTWMRRCWRWSGWISTCNYSRCRRMLYSTEPIPRWQQPWRTRSTTRSARQSKKDRSASSPATAPLQAPAAAEMERAVSQLEIKGVVIGASVDGRPLSSPDLRPFLRRRSWGCRCFSTRPTPRWPTSCPTSTSI